MSDIVERLREGEAEGVDGLWFVMAEAANEIERLRAENEKLCEALAAERERCAKIAENIWYPNEGEMIAKAIRENGAKP